MNTVSTEHTLHSALKASQSADCLVLTGNNRLRRNLLAQWEQGQAQAGKTVWNTPRIEPFRAWLMGLWEQTMGGALVGWQAPQAGHLLLSAMQAEQLWLDVIRQDHKTLLVNRPAAARNAHKAWQLLEQWQLREREWPHYCSHDMAAFAQWRRQLEQRLNEEAWLDPAELPRLIAAMIQASEIRLPSTIYTAGLQALAPAEIAVLEALTARGVTIENIDLTAAPAAAELALADTPDDEIKQAARWARQRLDQQADAQLAIVLLDAPQQALGMRQALMHSLHPSQSWGVPGKDDGLAFNFSLGDALARQPIVQAGLQALAWLSQAQPVEVVAALLQSPYLAAAAEEQEARAQLARWVLESDHPQCSMANVLHLISSKQLPCIALKQQLDAAKEAWQRLRESRPATVASWLAPVADCLKLLGWAQSSEVDQGINSVQWQAVASFRNLLNQLPELDLVSQKTAERDLVQLVKQAAASTMFQPQGSAAPVQVLGLLEALGQRFDGLWVVGASDDLLPAPLRPDPYIPREWQRELQMPHASSERERVWADSLIQQLSCAANEVIFSCAKGQGDSPLRPAQQVADLPRYQGDQVLASEQWLLAQLATAPRETLADDRAPAIPGEHPVAAAGGARLFEDQSACAFKSFARWRLNTRAIELPAWGLPAYELGNHLHRALEIFWQRTQNHANLLALADAELALHARAALADAEEKGRFASEPKLADSVQSLKMAVLHPLMVSWLQLEKKREPFTVVGKEEKLTARVERLRLQLSIDRIDQLADGSLVVTDYKTSQNLKIAAWNPPRPEQPQLPLYAVQLRQREQQVAAVMFAQIAPGKVQALGLTTHLDLVPGLSLGDASPEEAGRVYQPDLASLFPEWEAELNRLARDFTEGDAAVLPKDASTCSYCDFKPLCRIQFAATEEAVQ